MLILLPSTKPVSFSPWTKAATAPGNVSEELLLRSAITLRGSCARARDTHAAAPAKRVMNRAVSCRTSGPSLGVSATAFGQTIAQRLEARCSAEFSIPLMSARGQPRQGAASCWSSHVRNAPLATIGPKKAARREGPISDICSPIIRSLCRRVNAAGTDMPTALAVFRLIVELSRLFDPGKS
jgi:hypothetical protein